MPGAPADDGDEETDLEASLLGLYKVLVQQYGWSLREIDDTYLETLFDFLLGKSPEEDNTRIINGKVYKRAAKGAPPAWL